MRLLRRAYRSCRSRPNDDPGRGAVAENPTRGPMFEKSVLDAALRDRRHVRHDDLCRAPE